MEQVFRERQKSLTSHPRSPSDLIKELKEKMEDPSKTQLGWLIDPIKKKVYIYRPNMEIKEIENPSSISGDPALEGFVLDLRNYLGYDPLTSRQFSGKAHFKHLKSWASL